MANINVSVAAANVSVTETVSNIIITDAANVIIGNVTTTQSNINVTSTPSVVTVGTGPVPTPVTNAEIRAGVSATAPILYDQSTGVFSLDSNASFIGKTTDNLPQGSTNLYFTTALARASISGSGDIGYDANTGVISYTGTQGDITSVIAGAGLTGGGSSGDVTLNVGGGTGITVNADNIAVNMAAFTTTDLVEGANLYYTSTRANTAIDARVNKAFVEALGVSYTSLANTPTNVSFFTNDAGYLVAANLASLTANVTSVNGETGVVTLDTGDIPENGNLYFTTDRANSATNAYIAANPITVGGNLTVNGNINATGNINVQNVEDLYVRDQTIVMNANAASPANVQIVANRPGLANTELKWNEQSDRWTFTNDGTIYYNLPTSTTDVAEGANLYYSNARVNSFIQDNITTTDIDEGTNLYFTAARARGNISAAENITYNSTTGVIGLANALSNVYSITTDGQDFTINTNSKLVLTEQLKNVTTYTGNINGDGYAVFTGSTSYTDVLTHTSANALNTYGFLTGNTTSGSNVITGVSLEDAGDGSPSSISSVTPYYVWSYNNFGRDQYPFPPGTYVTSVDAGNSTITMSQPASATVALTYPSPYTTLIPGAYDAATGLLIGLLSEYTLNGTGSRSTIEQQLILTIGAYGYPATGPAPADFAYSVDTPSDYTAGIIDTSKLLGRTNILAPRTVLSAPRGLVVGDSDLTNRAENDSIASFGVNILWDGSSTSGDYAGGTPLTQILVKNYTDNNLQGSGTSALNRVAAGPRLFFTAAEGNKDEPFQVTYPRNNLELGRIAWWCATDTTTALGSQVPPAFISAVTNRDMTGDHNGGVGMYLSASPNTDSGRRGLFTAHQLGNTLIASGNATTTGASQPITFAPMWTSAAQSATGGSNAVAQFNNTLAATNYQWATINYDNASSKTGSRLSVTNGVSTVSGRNGNLVLALDRNDNGAGFGSKEWAFKLQPGSTDLVLTEDDVVRTTFSGGNISAAAFYGDGGNLTNVIATANTFDNIVVAGQSNVVATGSSTLTLAAGSGMTITTNATTDTITFSSTGGYGNAEVAAFLAAYGSNTIVTTGNVSAGAFVGSGEYLTDIAAANVDFEPNGLFANTITTVQAALDNLQESKLNVDAIAGAVTFFPTTANSNVSGYVRMVTTTSDPDYNTTQVNFDTGTVSGTGVLIGRIISDAGVLNGNTTPINVTIIGQVRRTSGFGSSGELYFEVYKRDSSGTETLIGTSPATREITETAYEQFSSTAFIQDTNFGATDRVVFKWYANDKGAGSFQADIVLGGGQPVRGSFPVPISVVPVNVTSTTVATNAAAFSGVLSSADDTVQKALVTLDQISTNFAPSNITLKKFSETRVALGNVTGDQSSNINLANGSIFTMTATGNLTISSVTGATAGSSATLIITQDGTGGKTLTSTMKFAGGSKTLSTAAGAIDIISLFYDGTTYYATLSKGYA